MLQTLLGYPSLQAGIAHGAARHGLVHRACRWSACSSGKVDPRKLLAIGLAVGALHAVLARLAQPATPATGTSSGRSSSRASASALLFVPLTTITMDPIPREKMGNATSIFNLMRNIGGSMGIATATTLLTRHRQEHTNNLVSHVDSYNPQVRALFEQLKSAFVAQGADVVTAADRARLALFGMVQREAMMLSFTDIFRWLSLLFLATLPLLLLMRSPRRGRPMGGAH